jgi:hypothetical protein
MAAVGLAPPGVLALVVVVVVVAAAAAAAVVAGGRVQGRGVVVEAGPLHLGAVEVAGHHMDHQEGQQQLLRQRPRSAKMGSNGRLMAPGRMPL